MLLCGVAPGLGVDSGAGVGVPAGLCFLEPNSQPNTDFFGLGVASGFSELAGAGAAVPDGFAPLSEAAGLFSSGFFSPAVVVAAAIRLSAVETSWAQTSAAQAHAATTVVRMERGFGMFRKIMSGGLCRLGKNLSSARREREWQAQNSECRIRLAFRASHSPFRIRHSSFLDSAPLPP